MNLTLFRSRHGILAALVVAGFVVLSVVWSAPFGRSPQHVRGFLLASGWASLALMLVVMLYVLRKYAHRGRYSPEFRQRVDYAALEKADTEIRGLRQRINAGSLGSAKAIEQAATAILRSAGVHKVNRVLVEAGPPGGEPWTVRMVPTEPLGRVSSWMHVHGFYGAAFGILLWMHGGFVPKSGFGWALAGLGQLVWITGLVGIVLWAYGPRWLTERERDLSIEEAHALRGSLATKRQRALESFDGETRSRLDDLVRSKSIQAASVRRLVIDLESKNPESETSLQDVCALIAQEHAVSRELRALKRIRNSFMAWKYVHIPAAILLTGLVAIHAFSVWRY